MAAECKLMSRINVRKAFKLAKTSQVFHQRGSHYLQDRLGPANLQESNYSEQLADPYLFASSDNNLMCTCRGLVGWKTEQGI